MKINLHREACIIRTPRVEMLETMFEVPATEKLSVSMTGDLNFDTHPWSIGLIVGPSGSGKTLLLEELFGKPASLDWNSRSVIDDFDSYLPMESIARVCQSVGFNTIPSWLRPYSVLSNGERFRAEVARRLLGPFNPCTIDEFTSVVDRQVAQFASHAVQKYIRDSGKQLVAASCHYDIIDWLQPDWILEPGRECKLTWRSLRERPPINVSISRVQYKTWNLFREFHYMSQELNKAARCYGLYVEGPTIRRHDVVDGLQHHDVHASPLSGNSDLPNGGGLRIPSSGLRYDSGDKSILLNRGDNRTSSQSRSKLPNGSCPIISTPIGSSEGAPKASTLLETSTIEQLQNLPGSSHPVCGLRHRPTIHPTNTNGRIASMCGVLHRPHPKVSDICGFTRMVTLPDFQGLGLAIVLANTVASAYKSLGKRLHSYPNHPAWIRSYQRNKHWLQIKQAGDFSPRRGVTSTVGGFGDKRCAVFMYIGPSMSKEEAEHLIYPEGRPVNDD